MSDFALKRQALIDHAKRVDATLAGLKSVRVASRDKDKQADESRAAFLKSFGALSKDTATVCHEILLARSRDEWSLAFAYFANFVLGQLSAARLTGDGAAERAMLVNLSRLSAALGERFPDRRMVIEPWQRSIAAFGEAAAPAADKRPHPHTDTFSQVICILRDTGPQLPFRELFVVSETGLHVVRPA